VIAAAESRDVPGFLAWGQKAGVWQVQPPPEILAAMVAVRVHLDDCGSENGPLRVIPGSHCHGWLDNEITRWKRDVETGDVPGERGRGRHDVSPDSARVLEGPLAVPPSGRAYRVCQSRAARRIAVASPHRNSRAGDDALSARGSHQEDRCALAKMLRLQLLPKQPLDRQHRHDE
jgi:hypothetical protein